MYCVWCGQLLDGIERGVVHGVCCGLGDEHGLGGWCDDVHGMCGGAVLGIVGRGLQ